MPSTAAKPGRARAAQEHFFNAPDGTRLFYRCWPARLGTSATQAVVLLHRGHEHSGRVQHLAEELDLPDFAMFAWDARGHGRSEASRTKDPSIGTLVADLDAFIQHISTTHRIPVQNLMVIAQSVGAVLAAAWVHDYAPPIRCMVLASPAFKVKLYVPFARTGLKLMYAMRGNFTVNSYVKARYLTHDALRVASYEADPLITRPISARLLLGLYDTAERVVADASAIRVPTQLLISGADWVVHHGPQHQFFDRLGSDLKEKHVLEGFYHDTLGEQRRRVALDKIHSFIRKAFAHPMRQDDLLQADQQGHTFTEFHTLSSPLPAWSGKRLAFAATKFLMKTGGRLSAGIRLGLETGFDSGSTLDYVYRNRPTGVALVGKVVDRGYLESVGWRGIRTRKMHLQQMLGRAMARLDAQGLPVRVLDIAAGHGRYVLDALAQNPVQADQVVLRDYSDRNVEQGRALIQERGLSSVARFEKGDAFDPASLSQVEPRPTLAVVSGLYELFPDNTRVAASLAGLAQAVPSGGYLVYTGQPWHPQLEFIARVLSSHRGHQAWVMRRRTQAEMDQLVRAAGFRKVAQLIDDDGIFSVSLAQRSEM